MTTVDIEGGNIHTIALFSDGTVQSWGQNLDGQLGNPANAFTSSISARSFDVVDENGVPLNGIVAISAGNRHNLALTEQGTVKAWGSNLYGQLGNGTTADSVVPVDVLDENDEPLSGIVDIKASAFHSLALTENGTVKAWGSNSAGELGNGTSGGSTSVAVDVLDSDGGLLSDVVAIEINAGSSYALTASGTLKVWGDNSYWTFGQPAPWDSSVAIDVVDSNGDPLSGIVDIATGEDNVLALMEDGTVKVWGLNEHGPLGVSSGDRVSITDLLDANGQPFTNVVAIDAGRRHTLVLTDDGTVSAIGYNADGSLGNGATSNSAIPVTVLVAPGEPLTDVVALHAGANHNYAKTASGVFYAWGNNSNGQFGQAPLVDSLFAFVAPHVNL